MIWTGRALHGMGRELGVVQKDSMALSFGVGFSDPEKTYMEIHTGIAVYQCYIISRFVLAKRVDLVYMNGYCLFNIA